MTPHELAFLREKEQKERRTFLRSIRNIAVLMIVVPACFGIIMESFTRSHDTPDMARWRAREDPHPYLVYLCAMGVLLLLLGLGSWIGYRRTLRLLVRDIRSGRKTVEQAWIGRKHYVENNDTYHFYLKAASRLSIEVSREDYERYREGDEINIEYSTFYGVYFGYF